MSEIEIDEMSVTIVTAFFEIGRGDFDFPRCEPRDDNKYLEYFKFWARIRNQLIVYTTREYEKRILEIRKEFHREDKTFVIVIDDFRKIEPEIYARMLSISHNQEFKNFRYYSEEVSNVADYDYIMLLKYWCMQDAVKRGIAHNNIFWMDFGFNHGGELYCNACEFDFEISGNCMDKIQLYALEKSSPDSIHAGQSLQLQFDTFCGCPVVSPAYKAESLWEMCKEAMWSLISLDCIDDDQQLLLMAYKRYPDRFAITASEWFLPLKTMWGGQGLSTVNEIRKFKKKKYWNPINILKKIYGGYKRKIIQNRTIHRFTKQMVITIKMHY